MKSRLGGAQTGDAGELTSSSTTKKVSDQHNRAAGFTSAGRARERALPEARRGK